MLVQRSTFKRERLVSCESTSTPYACSPTISKNRKPTGVSCSTRWTSGWSVELSWDGSTILIWLGCSNWLASNVKNQTTSTIKIQVYARGKPRYKKKTTIIGCWGLIFLGKLNGECQTTLPDFTTRDCKLGLRNGSRLLWTWSIESYLWVNLLNTGGTTGFTSSRLLSKTGFIKLDAMRRELRLGKQKLQAMSSIT